MKIILEFECENNFVDEDATMIFRFNENEKYKYGMFDEALRAYEYFFEYVVDAYSKEEVKEYYEFARKSKAFEGSKNIP